MVEGRVPRAQMVDPPCAPLSREEGREKRAPPTQTSEKLMSFLRKITPYRLNLLGFLALCIFALGFINTRQNFSILDPVPPSAVFFTALIFFSWMASAWGWGKFFCDLCGEGFDYFEALTVGLVFFIAASTALGHFGLLGASQAWIFQALAIMGLIAPLLSRKQGPISVEITKVTRTPLASIFLSLIVLVVFAQVAMLCLVPNFIVMDSTFYHLFAPSFWWQKGSISFLPNHPTVYIAAYWEYLYLWGFALVASANGSNLFQAQIFAQLVHAMAGYGLSLWALYRFCGLFLGASSWRWFVLCVIALHPYFLWTANYAKSDWGGIFFALSGATYFLRPSMGRRSIVCAAILFGLAVSIKVTTLFFIIPIVFFCLLWNRPQFPIRRLVLGGGLFMGVFAVILFRNFLATGFPVFPFDTAIELRYWGPTLDKSLGFFIDPSAKPTENIFEFFLRIPKLEPLFLLFFLFPLYFFIPRNRDIKILCGASSFGFLLMGLMVGRRFDDFFL